MLTIEYQTYLLMDTGRIISKQYHFYGLYQQIPLPK